MFFSRFSLYTNLNSKSWLYCYHTSMFEFNTELTYLSGTICWKSSQVHMWSQCNSRGILTREQLVDLLAPLDTGLCDSGSTTLIHKHSRRNNRR